MRPKQLTPDDPITVLTTESGHAVSVKGHHIAVCTTRRWADCIADLIWLTTALVTDFPGLVDTETETDGADLVDAMTYNFQTLEALNAWTTLLYQTAQRTPQ